MKISTCCVHAVLLALVLLSAVATDDEAAVVCPPVGFDALTAEEFDVERFIGFTWYSLAQQAVSVQPESQFYCGSTMYSELNTENSLWCRVFGCSDPPNFDVFNFGRIGSTIGLPNTINFIASIPAESGSPAKARIGFSVPPIAFRGDTDSNYWVVAAGKFAELAGIDTTTTNEPGNTGDEYDYAIIIAGEPDEIVDPDDTGSGSGCTARTGFWLFSYTPTPPAGTVEALKTMARDMGLGTAVLLDVVQSVDECNYGRPGFFITLVGRAAGLADVVVNFVSNLFF